MRGRALRAVGVLLVLLAAFGFCANSAYADGGSFSDEIIYGPDIYNVRAGTWCIQTYSASSFNAALTALGYDPYDSRFTTEVRSYLSDSSQGGSFYQFANAFSNNNNPSHGVTIYSVNYSTALDLNNAIYGAEYVYGASYTEDLYNGAKRRVEEVLSGDVGGGGSGGDDGGYEGNYQAPSTVSFDMSDFVSSDQYKIYSAVYVSPRPNPYQFPLNASFTVTLTDNLKTTLESTGSTYSYATYMLWHNTSVYETLGMTLDVILSANEPVINDGKITISGAYLRIQSTTSNVTANGHNDLTINSVGNNQVVTSDSNVWDFEFRRAVYIKGAGSGSEPVVPPNNWPSDTPIETPTPPELPDPTDPTLPTQPTDPTGPSDPTYITQPTYVTNVFTADLQGILDALDEHCQHLQDALYANIKDLNDNLTIKLGNEFSKLRTLVRQQIDWAVESIAECFETLTDNIYDLFHWLADQMDFNFSVEPYNDNSVLYWLRRIYSKLGGGVNTKPVDPVADPFDFWEWLYQLWQNFVVDLIALGADGLGEIAYMLGELIHKFPFSIPWDIAAMLALLVAEPVTPVLQWPMFYYTGSSVVTTTVNIDLSPYDAYVEPVRLMIKIAFAFALAWRTKDMLELLTIARGGND